MTNHAHSNHPSVRMIHAADRQDWPAVLELVAPNVKAYVGSQAFDRDGFRAMGQMFYAAFPDARHEIQAVHVADEYATVVATFTGTHTAEFMGLPATNKKIAFEVIHVDRIADGRVVEHRGQFDSAGLMQQLAGPPPADLRPLLTDLFDCIDNQRTGRVRELLAPDFRFVMGPQSMTADEYIGFSQMFFKAFPDGKHHHDLLFASDRAIEVGYFSGTHKGEFQGIPATGRSIKLTYLGVTHVVNGKIKEQRVEADFPTMMQQLTA